MITGINHITLSVRELDRSLSFYRDVLGFRPVARWPRGAYLLAGDLWLALVVDERARAGPLPEYTHVAFTVSAQEFERAAARIAAAGARIWQENRSEGASLYFEDPGGHKLEIHVGDLRSRLAEARQRPWPGLEFLDGDGVV